MTNYPKRTWSESRDPF